MITQITFTSNYAQYNFAITQEPDESGLVATSEVGSGGLNTFGKNWNGLISNIADCVKTWEER